LSVHGPYESCEKPHELVANETTSVVVLWTTDGRERQRREIRLMSRPHYLVPSRTRTIAIANQKGGVGKTTTAVNLGAGLARRGCRTLVIDLDIQCNTTHILHRELQEDEEGMCEMILEEQKLDRVIRPTSIENLFVAPAGESLVHADLNLAGMMGRDSILRECMRSDMLSCFEYILIDTSPYLGLLTINALVAADFVLIPVSCEFLPLLGIKWLLRTIQQVKRKLHPDLTVLGYLLTMYDRREAITKDVEEILREQFGEQVMETRIRVNTKHKAAPAEQKTIYEYEASSSGRGSQDYTSLTDEFLQRIHASDVHAELAATAV
jgi:chromosome partitioning protein